MNQTITMRHPTLPADQEIVVPKDAMPHYTAAGWQLVPQEELDERAARAKAAAEESADKQTTDEPEQPQPADEPTDRPARSRTKAAPKKDEES
ncbi:hypothetical protein [Streptomyces cyanogenus]|uniref:Uncharacterized protein n=1 Tax=Streptomyces cyanogenus TaxID=80860 RepID=A0ABX7TJX9_STRCY|nr:hypothetical protein [Streptomyces cyanogenus]QTD96969.1 hypothetical protein S1361_06370 [Streptomyces cyanogenus]